MKYKTTRTANEYFTFEHALFSGYAKDGGLYVPTGIPSINNDTLETWKTLTYPEIVTKILRLFIAEEELSNPDIDAIVKNAYNDFSDSSIIPLVKLEKTDVYVAELFHGPTLAFKDLALKIVGRLLDHFLKKRKERVLVLIGTSGDTGSSAIHSVKHLNQVDIVVLFPKIMCTGIQRLQITTAGSENVHCYETEGSSDDLDAPIKEIFDDAEFVEKHKVCCLNSINVSRVVIQIAHFVYIYLQAAQKIGESVQIVIPTGGAGNIVAGFMAAKMGVPITLVSTVNANDTVSQLLKTGQVKKFDALHSTWASAMDIQVAYNVERLVYFASNDVNLTKKVMTCLYRKEPFDISTDVHQRMREVVDDAVSVTDKEIEFMIKTCYNEENYVVCPHTATALFYHHKLPNKERKRVCVATAHPAKFPEALRAASIEVVSHKQVEALQGKVPDFERLRQGENWTKIIREKIETISEARQKQN